MGRWPRFKDLFKKVFARWSEDNVPKKSASLAYYTVFSIAPLLIIVIGIIGLIYRGDHAGGQIFDQIQSIFGKQVADTLKGVVNHTGRTVGHGIWGSIAGLIAILFGAAGVFGEIQSSLNMIWRVPQKKQSGFKAAVKQRFLSFAMVLGVGFLMTVSLIVSAGLQGAMKYLGNHLPGGEFLWEAVNFFISLGVIGLLFGMMFKILPDTGVRWKYALLGGLFTSLLFTIGKTLIGLYLGRSTMASAYGAAGSLVLLLLWVYYTAQILYLGAEFTFVYAEGKEKIPVGAKEEKPDQSRYPSYVSGHVPQPG